MSCRLERNKARGSHSPAFKPLSYSPHLSSSAQISSGHLSPSEESTSSNHLPHLNLSNGEEDGVKPDESKHSFGSKSDELVDRQLESESTNIPIADHLPTILSSPSFVGLATAFPDLGTLKTHAQSLQILFQTLREKVVGLDNSSIWLSIRAELLCDVVWMSVFCVACLIVAAAAGQSPASNHRWVWVFELVILSVWILTCLVIRIFRKYLSSRRLIMQALELIERFESDPAALEEESNIFRIQVDGSGAPQAMSVVYVLRKRAADSSQAVYESSKENLWIRIPSNFIIEGDIVSLVHGQVSPCSMTSLSIPDFQLGKGQAAQHAQSLPIYYFRSNETPILTQMDEIMIAQQTQPTLLRTTQRQTRKILFWLALVGYAISLAINGIRYLVTPDTSASWVEMWMVRPIYALLPMILLWSPLLYETLTALGSARLLTLIHALKNGQLSSAFQGKTNSFDDENEEALLTLRQQHRILPTDILLRFFVRLLFNHDPALLHAKQFAEVIGSATAVCVIDQPGIISSVTPFPEQIYLPADLQHQPHEQPTPIDHAGDPDHSDRSSAQDLDLAVQLQLTKDEEDMRARFNDSSAREFYLSALKPLGLNSLLNSNCQWSRPGTPRCGSPIFELASGFLACKCLLGPEIGFHVDALLENFSPVFELQIFNATFTQHLMCLVVEDASNSLQLLTQGSPDLLIRYCSEFWDGHTIRTFQQYHIDNIINACRTDSNYVAFAYRPLSYVMLSAFDPATFEESMMETPSDLLSIAPVMEPDHETTPSDKYHIYLSHGNEYRPVVNPAIYQAVQTLLADQNFIGMVSSTSSPQPAVTPSVEILRSAGVRFVWFSPDEKVVANRFASKIGLETDWNCCISLREREGVADPGQGIIHDGAPAQLPVGASQLRRHIAEVDNVPLLVPLFADCTPETTLEAIRILQENGEIVCCVGSVFNIANTATFAQANVSVAWQPSNARCLLDETDHVGAIPLLMRRHQNDRGGGMAENMTIDGVASPTWTSFSAGITSLPCAAVMHARSHFSHILDFMQEGRSFNEYTIKVLQLLIACQLTLFLIETFGYCAMLPSILGGFYQLWISWVVVSLFTISLVRTDPTQSPMQLYAEKNILHWSVIRKMFYYYFCLYSLVVVCIIVLYAWILYDVWANILQIQGIPLQFSQIFGFQENTHFTSTEFYTASAYAQSICTFAFVYYFAFLSSSLVDKKRAWVKLNLWWSIFSIIAILITAAFSVIVMAVVDGLSHLHAISYGTWILLFLFPICLIFPQLYVHRDYLRWAQEHQLRLRLEFNTKLGMYSPVQSPAFNPSDI